MREADAVPGVGWSRRVLGLPAVGVLGLGAGAPPVAADAETDLIVNGGFESGDLDGWTVVDHPEPFEPGQVLAAGIESAFGLFTSAPSGDWAVVHSLDGGGPGSIELFRGVAIPAEHEATFGVSLRAGWDIERWCGTCSGQRRVELAVQQAGGGSDLAVHPLLVIDDGTANPNSGVLTPEVDLSSHSGASVRLVVRSTVPEDFTGPVRLQIDDVSLTVEAAAVIIVPTSPTLPTSPRAVPVSGRPTYTG